MEGFVALESALEVDQAWDFDSEFAVSEPLPSGRPSAVDAPADFAWLFRQASLAENSDLGAVENRSGWVKVGEQAWALVRELSEFGGDLERRTATLAAAAELRLVCRRTDGWRSSEYDWPLLSD